MEEYTPNSNKYKEELKNNASEKKIEKAISGSAKVKKKSEIRKFTDIFVSEDASNVKSYILMDVLVPAIKKAISDIVTNGIDMVLYGEAGRSKKKSNSSRISYARYYERESDRRDDYRSSSSRRNSDFNDIIFESRGDAEAVRDSMDEIIDTYGVVSVGDLYDLADVSTDNYTVNKYGWTDIRNASVIRVRDGYMLKLPKATLLK